MDDSTQSAATRHRPVKLQVATEALNRKIQKQVFLSQTGAHAVKPRPITNVTSKYNQTKQSRTQSARRSNFNSPLLELTTLTEFYVPLPSKQRAAKFRPVYLWILLSALKSDDCIAL